MSDEKNPKSNSRRPLFIGGFLILVGLVLYLYAISSSGTGIVRYGFFLGVVGLFGWILIASGLLVVCWLAIKKIIKKRPSPPD